MRNVIKQNQIGCRCDDEGITDKKVGKAFAVHGAKCSCHMCGNPRKHYNEKTIQEKRVDSLVEVIAKDDTETT